MINLKFNEYQSSIEDLHLSDYPEEIQEQFYDFVTNVPFIRNLVSVDRPRAKDWPRDEKGRAIIDICNPPILEDTRVVIDKLRKFLREIDLTECDDKGKPIYQVNTITATIKQIPELAKSLVEAEKAVNKEIIEEGRARGGNNKTIFDDGINLW